MLDVEVHFWPDRFCGETKRTLTATSGAWKKGGFGGAEGANPETMWRSQ